MTTQQKYHPDNIGTYCTIKCGYCAHDMNCSFSSHVLCIFHATRSRNVAEGAQPLLGNKILLSGESGQGVGDQ